MWLISEWHKNVKWARKLAQFYKSHLYGSQYFKQNELTCVRLGLAIGTSTDMRSVQKKNASR